MRLANRCCFFVLAIFYFVGRYVCADAQIGKRSEESIAVGSTGGLGGPTGYSRSTMERRCARKVRF